MTTNTLVVVVLALAVLLVLAYMGRVEGMLTGYGYNVAGGAENAQSSSYGGAGLAIMGGSTAAPLVTEPMAGSGVAVPGAPPPPAPAGTCPARCTVYNEAGAVVYTGPCQPEVRLVPAGPPVPAGCPACPACQGSAAPGPIVPSPGAVMPSPGAVVPSGSGTVVPSPGAGVPSVRDWTPSSMAPAPAPGPYSQGPSLMTNGNIEVADMAGHIMWRGTGGTHIKTADWPQTTKFLSDVSQLVPAPGPMADAPAPGPMAGVPAPAPMFEAPAPGPMAGVPAPAPAPGPMAPDIKYDPKNLDVDYIPGQSADMNLVPGLGMVPSPAPAPGVPSPAPSPGVPSPAPAPAPGKQIPYVSNVPLAQATKANFDYEFYRATGPGLAKFTNDQLWNHWMANRARESRPWRVKPSMLTPSPSPALSPAPGVPSPAPAPGKQIPYVSNAAIGQATKANFDYEFYRATGPGLAKFTFDQLWNHWMANRTRESRPWRVKPSMLPALLPAGAKSPAPVAKPAAKPVAKPAAKPAPVSAMVTRSNFDYDYYRANTLPNSPLRKANNDAVWKHYDTVGRKEPGRRWRIKMTKAK